MAAKTPVTDPSVAGYVDPHQGIFGGDAAGINNLVSVGERHFNRNDLICSRFFFNGSVDEGEFWTSRISGIVALAWQPADATDDIVCAVNTNQATGAIGFECTNAGNEGWLWVYHYRY